MKVLVIARLGYTRVLMTHKLNMTGMTVLSASNSEDGLRMIEADNTIHAIITDLFPPGMDATQLFQRVYALGRRDDHGKIVMPEFFLMASSLQESCSPKEPELIKTAMTLGFKEVFRKPFNFTQINREMSEVRVNVLEKKAGMATQNAQAVSGGGASPAPALPEGARVLTDAEQKKMFDKLEKMKKEFTATIDQMMNEIR